MRAREDTAEENRLLQGAIGVLSRYSWCRRAYARTWNCSEDGANYDDFLGIESDQYARCKTDDSDASHFCIVGALYRAAGVQDRPLSGARVIAEQWDDLEDIGKYEIVGRCASRLNDKARERYSYYDGHCLVDWNDEVCDEGEEAIQLIQDELGEL